MNQTAETRQQPSFDEPLANGLTPSEIFDELAMVAMRLATHCTKASRGESRGASPVVCFAWFST